MPGKPLTFILENNYDFSGLDHLSLSYKIFEDTHDDSSGGEDKEKILLQKIIDLPSLEPGQKTEISFNKDDLFIPAIKGAVVFHADFILKENTAWAEKDHVIASAQKILKEETLALNTFCVAAVKQGNADYKLPLDLPSLLKPCLYRVPTQNDGLKTYMKLRGDPAMSFYYRGKAMYHWIDLDLLNLRTCDEKKEEIILNGIPAVRYSAALLAGENAAPQYERYTKSPGLGSFSYCLTSGKPMVLEAVFDLDLELPELARIGLTAQIPSSYREISWFGAGPHESYPDRKESAFLGRYRHSVKEFETPYVVPQENGNRSGVRNFTLVNADLLKNITIRAENPVNIGCSRYSQQNVWEAMHTCDLKDLSLNADGKWFLFIDIAQRGVGTATCGPDTKEEYRIRPGVFKMKLYIY